MKTGERRSSVWWRKGSAERMISNDSIGERPRQTIVAKKTDNGVISKGNSV